MESKKLILFMVTFFSTQKFEKGLQANEIKSLQKNFLNQTEHIYNHYRLPTAVRPENYKLTIVTLLEDPLDLRFGGEVLIKLRILEDSKNITLHSQDLIIDKAQIKIKRLQGSRHEHESDENNCIKKISRNKRYNYLIMQLCNVVKRGEKYLLTIPFKGTLREDSIGYFRSPYSTENGTHWIAGTQFEPIYARKAFPCFDEPALKATFSITLGHHKRYTALSNMPIKKRWPILENPDWIWSEFQESVPMSTYLVAYAVNNFSYVTSEATLNDRVKFRAWSRPNAINRCDYASIIGPKVLKFYENTFELEFPLTKIDQIAMPEFPQEGMENWGLVAYAESFFHFVEDIDTHSRKRKVAETVAHELAHQWFGNIVTLEWWSNLWLNEGFATYVSMWGTSHLHPDWSIPVPNPLEHMENILSLDALKSTKPLSQEVQEPNEIESVFEDFMYKKSFLVLRMMNYFIGNEAFLGGLKLYLKNHLYQNVKPDDLWNALNEKSHSTGALSKRYNIKTIMDSWTLQAGYPLIKVKRNFEKGTVIVTQMRYVESHGQYEDPSVEKPCWWVPLTYTTKSEHNFNKMTPRAWLECDADNEPIVKELTDIPADEWVCFNLQKTGLYKVLYDQANWNMLIQTLNSDNYQHIHVINRAQLIDDAMTLASSRHQNYDLVFRLIPYFRREKEYLPWKSALDKLSSIQNVLSSADEKFFKKLMVKILKPIQTYLHEFNISNRIDSSDESMNDFKNLIDMTSCNYQMGECMLRSSTYFNLWRTESDPDKNNPIPKDQRRTVYCIAIRNGDYNEYDFLKKRLLSTNSIEEKQRIFGALGCTQETQLLQRSLDWARSDNDSEHKRYFKFLLKSIAENKIEFRLVMNFLKKNFQSLYKLDHRGFSDLLLSIAKRIRNQRDYEDLKEFLEKNKKYFQKIKFNVSQVLETAAVQVHWKDHSYEEFMRHLKNSLSGPKLST